MIFECWLWNVFFSEECSPSRIASCNPISLITGAQHSNAHTFQNSQIHTDTHITIYGLPLVKFHFTNYYNCIKSVLGDLHVHQCDIRIVVFLNYSNVIFKCLYSTKECISMLLSLSIFVLSIVLIPFAWQRRFLIRDCDKRYGSMPFNSQSIISHFIPSWFLTRVGQH